MSPRRAQLLFRRKNTNEIVRAAAEQTDKTTSVLLRRLRAQNERERLDAFRRSEPLFCELFWNRDKYRKVSYVPEIYVRHLLQLRLEDSGDENLDENHADRDTAQFFQDATDVGYVQKTDEHHAFRLVWKRVISSPKPDLFTSKGNLSLHHGIYVSSTRSLRVGAQLSSPSLLVSSPYSNSVKR
jgi:hypothetical protein